MDIPFPDSLSEVITDGILGQFSVDQVFAAELGKVTGVEFNFTSATELEVRINRAHGAPFETTGDVVAWITGEELEWVSERGAEIKIPELQGTQPLDDDLISAIRTLYRNLPAFIAPLRDGRKALVIIECEPTTFDVRRCLIEGLPRLKPSMDQRRALASYAAFLNLGIRFDTNRIAFSDGTSVLLRNGRPCEIAGGLGLRDVRADSAFMSAEHQLLFDAITPSHDVTFDPATNTAVVAKEHHAKAIPLAVIDGSRWVWSWSLQELNGNATDGLARFGFDNGLFPLTIAEITVADAKDLNLIDVAKQVLHVWTHAFVQQDDGTTVVLLLDHPRLHLPPATYAAIEATLYQPLSPDLDARRAVASYAAQRNVAFDGYAITVDNQHVNVEFNGEKISRVS